MVTKKDLADTINAGLGLNLSSLENLKKEDLESLAKLVGDPSNLVKIGFKSMKSKMRKEYLEKPVEEFIKSLDERPLINLAKESKDNNGLLGLGLLTGKRIRALQQR